MSNTFSETKYLHYLRVFGFLLLGAAAGAFVMYKYQRPQNQNLSGLQPIKAKQNEYKLIQPLLGYRLPKNLGEAEYSDFLKNANATIEEAKKREGLTKASLYLRDLTDNHWAGIGEQEQFQPASLLKVVIMITYYKRSENNPQLLNQKLIYTKKISEKDSINPFNSSSNLHIGESYTVDDLINQMIINSDNGAMNTLLDALDPKTLNNFYSLLDLKNPADADDYTISTQTYSLFFRILFNSTYLNYADSEKALQILSQVKFKDGINAGLPENLTISHKFGEHISGQNGVVSEIGLHDCGIIYYPNHPYLLCVMTLGEDLTSLRGLIKNISGLAYEHMVKKYH